MRISGGTAKGRRTAPKRLLAKASGADRLRPTSSKVREALFDILGDKIKGACFVDLYAGTGTVGLEALSRGAAKALFVETNRARIRTIRESVSRLGFNGKTVVVEGTAYGFLKRASAEKKTFDILFLDPPYGSEDIMRTLLFIGERGLLGEGGAVIVEHFFKRKLPEQVGELTMIRSYRYGDTILTIYRKKG
ncbi:MAG: 16S rRNA (guanine(966)-N(2))-methyltransferase RsmD [Nitrospira sp.]|nr:16S rRNA (guanine(966)-N(2))-methyltransferase RsmD [Nitrospira sp.]